MNARRLECWPLELLATSTHDTKRGEDARARINVLSEMPDAWSKAVGAWMRINGRWLHYWSQLPTWYHSVEEILSKH